MLDLREITEQAVDDIFSLAPFGHGNPPPLFAALNVEVAGPPAIMKEKHLRLTVRQNGRTLTLKAWNMAGSAPELSPGTRIDIAFQVEEDAYSAARGYPPWCAMLKDFRVAKLSGTGHRFSWPVDPRSKATDDKMRSSVPLNSGSLS